MIGCRGDMTKPENKKWAVAKAMATLEAKRRAGNAMNQDKMPDKENPDKIIKAMKKVKYD